MARIYLDKKSGEYRVGASIHLFGIFFRAIFLILAIIGILGVAAIIYASIGGTK